MRAGKTLWSRSSLAVPSGPSLSLSTSFWSFSFFSFQNHMEFSNSSYPYLLAREKLVIYTTVDFNNTNKSLKATGSHSISTYMISFDVHNGIVSQTGQIFFYFIIIMNFVIIIFQTNKMSHRFGEKLKTS